jgi:hypothetical protein
MKPENFIPCNDFTCCGKVIPSTQFKEHLKNAHDLDIAKLKGTKSLTAHIDYDDRYSYHYEWVLEGGLKFTQYILNKRIRKF